MGIKNKSRIRRNQRKKKQKRVDKMMQTAKNTIVDNKDTNIVTLEKKSTIGDAVKKPFVSKYKKCHIGFTEVYPHLFVGRESDLNSEFVKSIDVLVPLNDLDGKIWNHGYRKEIIYLPIADFSVLPTDVETKYAKRIVELIKDGENVAIFCQGGHGRTGYFASLVLFELGYKNPIHLLKTKYCDNVVESYEQLVSIAEYCDNEVLIDLYQKSVYGSYASYGAYRFDYEDDYFDFYDTYKYRKQYEKKEEKVVSCSMDAETENYNELIKKQICGDCVEYLGGRCVTFNERIRYSDEACSCFISY